MKVKVLVTKKSVRQFGMPVLSIPYCKLDSLLKYEEPFAYSSGVYGWSCDYYQVTVHGKDDVIISTGYRPTGKVLELDLIQKYNNQGRKVIDKHLPSEEERDALRDILEEFIVGGIGIGSK